MKILVYFLGIFIGIAFLSACDSGAHDSKPIVIKGEPVGTNTQNIDAWDQFLNCWSLEALQGNSAISTRIPEWKNRKRPAADLVANLEKKLNLTLPRSYKDFLFVSGGNFQFFNHLSDEELSAFHEIGKVDVYSKLSKKNWQMWKTTYQDVKVSDELYFVYGNDQLAPNFRAEYLDDAIEVGSFYLGTQDFILLNPVVKTSNNEAEAWWLSSKNPGADRYKTFADLMIALYFNDVHGIRYPEENKIVNSCANYIYI